MPPDEHPQPGAGPTARLLGELQGHLLEHDDVVLAHRALLLMAEDALQVDALKGDEGAGGVRRRSGELLVVGGDEVRGEVGVGGGERGDAGAVEFVDESALEGPIEALTAPPPLGRIRGDMLDAEVRQGAAHLRETRPPAFGV